jgi:hypothetical protein
MDSISKTDRQGSDFGTRQAAGNAFMAEPAGRFATILSAVALSFSAFSYYDSSLKAPDLSIFVPPMIHYARDGGDVFNIPITITNEGARTGTVLAMELVVENLRPGAERKTATFHSAFLGDYPRDDREPLKSFAPISVAHGAAYSETVRFYNSGDVLPFVVDDKGDYRFTLKVLTAKPAVPDFIDAWLRSDPKPLVFELNLPYLAVQQLEARNATLSMFNKLWKPTVSTPGENGVSRAMSSEPQ